MDQRTPDGPKNKSTWDCGLGSYRKLKTALASQSDDGREDARHVCPVSLATTAWLSLVSVQTGLRRNCEGLRTLGSSDECDEGLQFRVGRDDGVEGGVKSEDRIARRRLRLRRRAEQSENRYEQKTAADIVYL